VAKKKRWYQDEDLLSAALGVAALAAPEVALGLHLAEKANKVVAAAKDGDKTAAKKVAAVKTLANTGDPVAQNTVEAMKVLSAAQEQVRPKGFYDQGLAKTSKPRKRFGFITIGHDPFIFVGAPPPLGGRSSRGGVSVSDTKPGGGRVLTPAQAKKERRKTVAYGGAGGSAQVRYHGSDPCRGFEQARTFQKDVMANPRTPPTLVNPRTPPGGPMAQQTPLGLIDPGTGYPTDESGNPYDPATGRPIDPATGLPFPQFDPNQYMPQPGPSYGGYGDGGGWGGAWDQSSYDPYDPYGQAGLPWDPYGQAGLPWNPYGPYDPTAPVCTQKQTYDPSTDSFYSNQVNQQFDPDTNTFLPMANYNPYNPYMAPFMASPEIGDGPVPDPYDPFDSGPNANISGWALNYPYRTTAQQLAALDSSPGVAVSARELYNRGLGRPKTTKGGIVSEALKGRPQFKNLYDKLRTYL